MRQENLCRFFAWITLHLFCGERKYMFSLCTIRNPHLLRVSCHNIKAVATRPTTQSYLNDLVAGFLELSDKNPYIPAFKSHTGLFFPTIKKPEELITPLVHFTTYQKIIQRPLSRSSSFPSCPYQDT